MRIGVAEIQLNGVSYYLDRSWEYVAGCEYGWVLVSYRTVLAGLPNEGKGMCTVGQSPRDRKPRLVGHRAFVGPPTWRSSCRDGSLELNIPRVPSN